MCDTNKELITIPSEKAVFWLDKDGRWRNRHGRFRKPSISARFHSCINKDGQGYYLIQEHAEHVEKIYFPYEDTALFVSRIKQQDEVLLILNNGRKIPLSPIDLFIEQDQLYTIHRDDRIKFTQNALMQITGMLEFSGEENYIRLNDRTYRIPEY